MNDSDSKNNRATQLAKPNKSTTVSERKLKANRENAKKSTGPRTSRGKGFSRRNALKHGLFVRHITEFEALGEDPREFEDLLEGLWRQYEPVGRGEEVEVERVALCCWRFRRVWRYENAINIAARRDFVRRELAEQEPYCREEEKLEKAIVLHLQNAKRTLENGGQISQELVQLVYAGFDEVWDTLSQRAQEWPGESDVSKSLRALLPEMRSGDLRISTLTNAIEFFEALTMLRWSRVMEAAVGQHAIPNGDALDKILRYEAAIDRYLGRSLDRLERLQRRRKGEMIPPPVSVRLTRG
jgi:hypothetical protein